MESNATEVRPFAPGRFPNPVVQNSYILSGDVEEDANSEVHNVLSSSSGMFYKFSIVIKKSVYGLVVKGLVLRPTEHGTYQRTGEEVAIKVCSKDVLQRIGGMSLENPIMEIGAMQDFGQPRHPNLSLQYECCVDDKNIYSVLQFHKGSELFDHILNCGPLNEATARVVFQQLILALFRLQQRSIAHRDISLENMMYTATTHAAVLIDFGLSTKLQRDPHSGDVVPIRNTACGKAYYMPPEVDWSGNHPTPINPLLSDVWSAGMSLLYALLGFPPIERADGDDVRYQYLTTGRLPELLEHWEIALSGSCIDLIQTILRPEPEERPSLAQIWQHSWMQQPGLPMPYASLLSADEIAALSGPLQGGPSSRVSTGLTPLQAPDCQTRSGEWADGAIHSSCSTDRTAPSTNTTSSSSSTGNGGDGGGGVTLHPHDDHDDEAMCVSDGDEEVEGEEARYTDCTTREYEAESFRSSVDSHWSATTSTTPTGRTSTSSGHNYGAAAQACGALPPPHSSSSGVSGGAGSAGSGGGPLSTTSNSSAASPYFTRSRANSPHVMVPPDPSAHIAAGSSSSGAGGSGAGTVGTGGTGCADPDRYRSHSAAAVAPSTNNGSATPSPAKASANSGVFKVYQTRSASFGKANVNYTS